MIQNQELGSGEDSKVLKVVPNNKQKSVSLMWVLPVKETPEGLKPKACLVACGFEEDCLAKSEKEFHFCSIDTLQTVLAVTAQSEWYQRCIAEMLYTNNKICYWKH